MRKFDQELITLDSGLRILLTKTPGYYKSYIETTFLVGAENETDHKGICHLLEHSVFNGTERYKKVELAREFEKISAYQNAITNLTRTYYYCTVPKTNIKRAMELWSEIIFNSNFEEHILDKEKQVVVQEINQTLDNPSKVAHHKMSQMLYGGTGLANITLGTVESINNISRQNLLDFRDKHYNSNNCIVSITGDFTGNEVKSLVEEYIEPKISKHGKLSGYTEEVKSNKGKRADLYIDKIQTNGLLCFKIPTYYEPDNEKIWMINRILGAGMASRLFNKIRQQGLAYSIGSTTYDTINNSKLEVYFKTSKEKLDTTISEIKKVIEDVRQNGVTQEEFDDEKRKSIEACFMNQDEPNSRLGYYLMNNKLYDPQERIKEIMKLEKTDCERAFKKHIDTNNVYEVYVGPHAEQKATKEDAHTEL